MQASIRRIVFGNDKRVSGAIALAVVALVALGCTCGDKFDLGKMIENANTASTNSKSDTSSSTSDGEMPSRELIDAMVGETTADFNFSITTNDFSDMYQKASPNFQATYTEEEFKKAFKEFVDKKRVIGPILSKAVALEPQYSPDPYIRTEKGQEILVVNGKYPTKPVPMTFEYEYIKRDDEWKLLKLVIRIV